MNCDFCFEKYIRSNDIDIEAIKNIPKLLEDNYPDELKDDNFDHIDLGFLGGELFSDDISDSMFEVYRDLCNDIILLIRKYLPDIKFEIDWLSNGVFTKHERVLRLFTSINDFNTDISIGLSYDPIGRYKTKEQFELFEKTFWYFYNTTSLPRLHLIITLTKNNINALINDNIDFINDNIKFIKKNINISMNYYTPNSSCEEESPNDDDLFNFYKWSIDNDMFQFGPIKEFIEIIYLNKIFRDNIPNKKIIYYDKNFVENKVISTKVLPRIDKGISSEDVRESDCFINMNNRGCLICEYRNVCISPYYYLFKEEDNNIWHPIVKYDKSNSCSNKRTIKYLYDHPEIKDRYLEYDKKGNIK
jgi:hypothetical protein